MSSPKKCSPNCEFFRCGQKALQFRGGKAYCRFADDLCSGANCKFTICLRNKLLPDGTCALTIKRLSAASEIPPEKAVKGFKVKGKLKQRLGEEEVF
ncbi:MAG: hypothetical protein AYL30_003980 [Candidatus Hecatellales archaeon B24]|nr:MAG: hypothetical protein AYL30_003980 [Candidatus Hecatellales archaeon B24]